MKIYMFFVCFLSMYLVHAVPNLTHAQKIAHAIEDMQIDEIKILLPQLSTQEKSGFLHKPITILQRVGFQAPPHFILIRRTPMERINATRSLGVDVWRRKLAVIEFLLRVYCEPTPTNLVYV